MATLSIVLGSLIVILLLVGVTVSIAKRFTDKMNMTRKRWWLLIHIVTVIVYFCGVLGTLILGLIANSMSDISLIYAAHNFIQLFDWFLIIPGAIGSLITGTWLSVRSNWGGLTQYYWILVKLNGNMGAIIFGSIWIRQWIGKSMDEAINDPLHNSTYILNHNSLLIGTAAMLALLIFLVAISIFKPWGKRKKQIPVH